MSLNLSPVSSRTRSKSPREHRPRYLRDYCRSCLRLLAAKACRYSSCTGLPEDPDKTRFWYLSSDIYCSCSCTCNSLSDSDSDYESDNESDADYSPLEDEQDDQIHEQLIGPAEAAEETLARKYGWQVCATSEPLQGSIISDQIDRDYHFESPGHAAVAAMHDIGIPAESSLANSDNIITQSEAKSLERKLDPWELDVIHANTRNQYLQFGASRAARRLRMRFCGHCHRMRTEESTRWAAMRNNAVVCEFCDIVRRPATGTEDPDWSNVNTGVYEVTEICLCRCACDVESLTSAWAETGLFATEIGSEMMSEMDENGHGPIAANFQSRNHLSHLNTRCEEDEDDDDDYAYEFENDNDDDDDDTRFLSTDMLARAHPQTGLFTPNDSVPISEGLGLSQGQTRSIIPLFG